MTDSTALVELEKRLAEATGPDRVLDGRIFWTFCKQQAKISFDNYAIGIPREQPDDWDALARGLGRQAVIIAAPEFTQSIDCALALVSRCLGEDNLAARDNGFAFNGGPYYARLYVVDTEAGESEEIEVTHRHSESLAICLALVRALQSQSKREAGDAVS